jgi:tRNA(Ile)-lysidine synthase
VSGPAPAVAAVRSAVRGALADLPAGALVLVACSGGPDSLALAAAAAFVAPRAGLRAGAVVVDHGWRPSSAVEAVRAAAACGRLGLVPVRVVPVGEQAGEQAGEQQGEPDVGGGPEAVARRARYEVLARVAGEEGADAVLLGHTLDDQAETVLLGLARGSGARSLAGMPARRGPYRRPLLDLPRAVTHEACAALGLEPVLDPANADPRYTRTRVRTALAVLEDALGPGLPAALARTAALLAEDAAALDAAAEELLAAARAESGHVSGELSCKVLAAAPDAVRRRALLAAARAAGAAAGSLSRRHALALDALVVRPRGQGPVHLPGGVVAGRGCGTLWFAPRGTGRPSDRPTGEQEDRAAE